MMHKFMQVLVVLLMVVGVGVAGAQDVNPTPNPSPLHGEGGGEVVNPVPDPSPLYGEGSVVNPVPDPSPLYGEGMSNAADLITLIAGIGLGMIAGGGSVLVVVSRMRHDVVLLTAMERLAASWPAETKDLLNGLAGVLTEITDGTPVAEKQAVEPQP